MLTNNNEYDSGPIDEELNSIQKDIIHEIRKTQNIIIFQIIALLLFALFNGGFFVPYITYLITGKYLIPRIIIAFIFFIAATRSVIRFSPFLRKGYKTLQNVEKSNSNGKFKSGIVHYVAEFYQLSKHGKKKNCKKEKENDFKIIPKVFLWELIAFLIMGVLFIGYDIILLVLFPTTTPFVVNIILFSITLVAYIVLILLTLVLKKRSSKWSSGFHEISKWGQNVENSTPKSMEGE